MWQWSHRTPSEWRIIASPIANSSAETTILPVTNNWINCLTPALVADDTLTVFTSCLGVVPVAVIQGCFVVRHSLISWAPCLSTRKINRTRHLLELGRLLSRRAELYDLSAVKRWGTLQRFPKVLRYIKLNYLCHDHLLLYEPLCRGWGAIQLSGSNGPTKPIRIDNARTRTIGACARVLCKWRMISST